MSRIILTFKDFKAEKHRFIEYGNYGRYDHLLELASRIRKIPGGYLLKIIWDDPDEYPEHALGYEQYTVRPYHLGYGCDGTTDRNIHLIAATVFNRIGINYGQAYIEAYSDEFNNHHRQSVIDDMNDCSDPVIVGETVIPEDNDLRTIQAVLHDLNAINNRSLVARLTELLLQKGFDEKVQDWHTIDFTTETTKEIPMKWKMHDVEIEDRRQINRCEPENEHLLVCEFRLLDDDDHVVFEGRCEDLAKQDQDEAFQPLDWGERDSGCTQMEFRYSPDQPWEAL